MAMFPLNISPIEQHSAHPVVCTSQPLASVTEPKACSIGALCFLRIGSGGFTTGAEISNVAAVPKL